MVRARWVSVATSPAGLSMPGVKLTTQAYCKMVLHGAKYPHCAVNGLLVAERQRPRKEHPPGAGAHTLFVDCIPLFHGTLALAPMLEVALTLVSSGSRGILGRAKSSVPPFEKRLLLPGRQRSVLSRIWCNLPRNRVWCAFFKPRLGMWSEFEVSLVYIGRPVIVTVTLKV